jgi:hypothetical protein
MSEKTRFFILLGLLVLSLLLAVILNTSFSRFLG